VPRRAVWVSIIFTCIISLINFGPVVGFNAIVSLTIIAITFSYSFCIAALIWRRCFGKPLPKERFSLGRPWGMLINLVALGCTAPLTVLVLYVLLTPHTFWPLFTASTSNIRSIEGLANHILRSFPPVPNPTPAYTNWAILVFGVVAIFSGCYYAIAGRKNFNPPIRKDEYSL